MQTVQIVRCPNCGSLAERRLWCDRLPLSGSQGSGHQLVQTECPVCDYLMVMCCQTGRVIEAYVPVRAGHFLDASIKQPLLVHS
jgi:predicted RNA-binding Zn-ribbon protein involved in translation (DUF1610 family)